VRITAYIFLNFFSTREHSTLEQVTHMKFSQVIILVYYEPATTSNSTSLQKRLGENESFFLFLFKHC